MKYKVGDRVKLKDVIYDENGHVEFAMKNLFGKVVCIGSVNPYIFYCYGFSYGGMNYGVKEDEIVGRIVDDNKVVV